MKAWLLLAPGVRQLNVAFENYAPGDEIFPQENKATEMLTHLPLGKMAAILADDILKCIFLNENDKIPIETSLKLVPRGPINNNWFR